MKLEKRIKAFSDLGKELKSGVINRNEAFVSLCRNAGLKNSWFTQRSVESAAKEWGVLLDEKKISEWLRAYSPAVSFTQKRVGVINAGNIPFVGLHDFCSVLLCGHGYIGKNSSEDPLLLPYVASLLCSIEPEFKDRIRFAERLEGFDAVIATGSNNSARYFESYFGKYPHVIRMNRNAVAILAGDESAETLKELGRDIFQYFGLGCRNVSKVYVPAGYDFREFFEAMYSFSDVMQHNKYMNNFDYNNAMFLMKQLPFLQNGFLIVREDERIASPVAVLHYEKYASADDLIQKLDAAEKQIQCVVCAQPPALRSRLKNRVVGFGAAQSPSWNDYADGVDTIRFLTSL
jgi:hypothetical protein